MRPRVRRLLPDLAPSLVGLVMLTVSLWAPEVLACPVCGSTKEESRVAFILMTGFLTAMPLLLIGAAIWVGVRRVRAAEQAQESDGADFGLELPEG